MSQTNASFSKDNQAGTLLMLVVVMTGLFVIMFSGVLSLVTYQKRLTNIKVAKMQALHIAEAGVNYYRWHLAHAPTDYTDATGEPGPYVHDYYDPTTGLIGTFSLEITPPATGTTIVNIQSTGWINKQPDIKKTVEVNYGQPSLARYSFLTNTDIWLGDSEHVGGEMHSNGGIRMDGTNDSLVTSAMTTYQCQPSHGCSNPYEEKDGVWGSGPDSGLWDFPVPIVDFNTITLDLAAMQTEAQTNGDYYDVANYGYPLGFHIVFLADGTYNIYSVDTLVWPEIRRLDDDTLGSWDWVQEQIDSETLIGNFPVPTDSVIFTNEDTWVEGTLNGKVTVASAYYPESSGTDVTIYVNNNLQYLARDNTHTLGIVAQKNVLVPQHAPDNLTIDAMLLAQKGRVMRLLYWPYEVQDSIEVYGGIITNNIWTWTWVNGSGDTVDGYDETSSIFHTNLLYAPPPHFPTDANYDFISWEELPDS